MITNKTALIIGASRGLGLGLAREFLKRGWIVVGTAREGTRTKLHDLLPLAAGKLGIELLDITDAAR
jgi:NAD(P)-dependent dehydrogenase (short-subunit alcohol dehydrogenase family)